LINILGNKKAPQKRGLVMLVGRARFELATNGLKDLRIVINSNQNINLNLPRKCCDIGGSSPGAGCELLEFQWLRHQFVGLPDKCL